MKMSVEEIDIPEFEKYLDSERVFVKARGEVSGILKIYAYSYHNNLDVIYLIELNLNFNNQEIDYTIKSQNSSSIPKYEEYILKVIDPIL